MKLSQELDNIVKLKAAVYANGSEAMFFEKAIKAYQEPAAHEHLRPATIYVKGREITVMQTPHIMRNGYLYENIHISAALEEVLEKMDVTEVQEVDFAQLIQKGKVL